MRRTVGTDPVVDVEAQSTTLSGEHDTAADEYTVYPTCAGDDELVTTWLTVDTDAVVDLDDWR